ncbi:MAG: glycosyl hydrolase 53 family protein, partial [Anaerolineae bacterium]|nr:glycosyl hydrolase 53 family protein [Anaerolineae bacterium]
MHTRRLMAIGAVLCALLSFSLLAARAQPASPAFYFGVDLSYANEMEDCGAIYRENGTPRDPFALLSERGASLVRARLWHAPDWTEYSTLDDVTRTFARARAAGMATLLDFHYSDNWADPGRQEIPAAWAAIAADNAALADEVYAYTAEVLHALHAADLAPDFVQVGNEINSGLLKLSSQQDWPRDARLINAGIRAVRDFAAETGAAPRIILHIAQPENADWWFAQAEAHGITDFDIIGLSYYPQWSTFTIADVGAHVTHLR